MMRSLQKRFVLTAMFAVTLLLAVLLGAINLVNFGFVNRGTDNILAELVKSQGAYTPPNGAGSQGHSQKFPPPRRPSPDAVMGARFFQVFLDESGAVTGIDLRHIYAVSQEDAQKMAAHVQNRRSTAGWYKHFKYQQSAKADGTGSFLVFLDISRQQNDLMTVGVVSCGVGALCWLAMLLLLLALSPRAIRPIAENMEKQRQFVTNAGHEIKTPLTIILANTDALELHGGESKWSRNIRAQTIRLNGLMQNLLTLAKMEESSAVLPMSDFSLTLLAEELLDLYQEPAAAKGITLTGDLPPELCLHANRESIEQLFCLLLDNALKYTPAGGRVVVGLKKTGKQLCLQVKNTCEQLPQGDLEKLFERFYRGDAARTQSGGGYGIGLSAARAIAQAHGGTVSASCESGTQTMVFTVRLPNSSQ